MAEIIPTKIEDWNEETMNNIIKLKYEENEFLEFKEVFIGRDKNFRQKIINFATSFANSRGGYIIFGISDDYEIHGVELDERVELNLQISQLLENTIPQIKFEVKKLDIDSKILVVLRIEESDDKPVQSSDKSFYIRVNSQTLPISRDYLRDLFLTKDIKNQKLEALNFEIEYMHQIISELGPKFDYSPGVPPFYKFRLDELQRAISDYRGYFKEGFDTAIRQINSNIATLKKEEKFYEFALSVALSRKWGGAWADLNGFLDHSASIFKNTNHNINSPLSLLEHYLKELKKYI